MTKRFLIGLALAALAGPAGAAKPATAPSERTGSSPTQADGSTSAVSLGEYTISDLRAVEGAKLRIHFELYAYVDGKGAGSLRGKVEEYKHRIRNEVLIAIRLCDQSDFQEPDLDHVRRRILARLNRSLPALPIERLLVGAFEYFVD